ncbi:MAG TPA: PHP domain-containing protein [Candidatus Thermoplasmatota archaeon]|nr:PHP domain-containing protein [Candidatus Thermoplasmatota archaeon]
MKSEIVTLLTAMGIEARRQGEDRRSGAYLRAATSIARQTDFEALLEGGRLRDIPGVGESIERTIRRFVDQGETPSWLPWPPSTEAVTPDVEIPPSFPRAPFGDAPDLHCHTTWSDGTLTIDEVVAFARAMGAHAIGISDHSGSLKVARGLDPDAVRAQWADIERVQAANPDILILRGTECDILRDGSLDHPDDLLGEFDYVIGSVHSHMKLPRREQTERYLTALENPYLTVLGHPTTRMLNKRPPADVDLEAVFEKAAEMGVALEVNGSPRRKDLDAGLAQQALEAGALLSLGSDGHSAHEMLQIANARRTAQRAGADEENLVNYRILEEVVARRGLALAYG